MGAVSAFADAAVATPRAISPNSKLNHACIGVGNMGWADLNSIISHSNTQIVALCDVDKNYLARAAEKVPGARIYTDWREMLAKEGERIDSINVSVPDHMHTIIATNAMRAGKHIYCQKPLCHDIAECRLLEKTTREMDVVTQLGVQFAATIGDRMIVQMLRDNVVGTVERLYIFSNREGVSRIKVSRPPADPVPDSLDWDLWLGTAPFRPYAKKVYHPRLWRVWQDFGSAWIGDMGCHLHSAVWRGIGLTAPISVKAEVQESWKNTPARFKENWPQAARITWVYPGNEKTGGKPLTVDWYDGVRAKAAPNLLPPPELQAVAQEVGLENLPLQGSLVVGSEGWILLPHTAGPRLILKDKSAVKPPTPKLPPRPNHYHEFLDACVVGKRARADFSVIAPMMESILLGNLAERVPDTLLKWDASNMKITNVAEANRFLRRTYRKGWELEGLG